MNYVISNFKMGVAHAIRLLSASSLKELAPYKEPGLGKQELRLGNTLKSFYYMHLW